MLYAYKEIEQVTSLRLIITRIINEIEMNENIVFQNHIFKIIKRYFQVSKKRLMNFMISQNVRLRRQNIKLKI